MLTNFLLFQVGWFACVLGAAHGMGWPGAAAAGLAVLVRAITAPRRCAALAPGRVMTLPHQKSITVVNSIRQTNQGSHQP